MNRITKFLAPQDTARELVAVTFATPAEITAGTALSCLGYAALWFYVVSQRGDYKAAQQALDAVGDLAAKIVANLPPQEVIVAQAKWHNANGDSAHAELN